VLDPEKAKREEDERRDKTESADKERRHLEQLRLAEEERRRSFGGLRRKLGFVVGGKPAKDHHWGEEKEKGKEPGDDGRRALGSGPEDGMPLPERKR